MVVVVVTAATDAHVEAPPVIYMGYILIVLTLYWALRMFEDVV